MKKKKIVSKCYDTILELSDERYFGCIGNFTYIKETGTNIVLLPVTKKIIRIFFGTTKALTEYKLLEKHGARKSLKVYLYLGEDYINHPHLEEIKEVIKNNFREVE